MSPLDGDARPRSKAAQLARSALVGRESATSEHMREESAWIGKPWRRAELVTRRYFYRGATCAVERDLSLHIGSRRLGFNVTLIVSRAAGFDYSEERP